MKVTCFGCDISRIGANLFDPIIQGQHKEIQAMITLWMQKRVWRTLLDLPAEQYNMWIIAWSTTEVISDDTIQGTINQYRVWMIAWSIEGAPLKVSIGSLCYTGSFFDSFCNK